MQNIKPPTLKLTPIKTLLIKLHLSTPATFPTTLTSTKNLHLQTYLLHPLPHSSQAHTPIIFTMGLTDIFSDFYSALSFSEAYAEAPLEKDDEDEKSDEGGEDKDGEDEPEEQDEKEDAEGDDEEEEEDEPVDPKPALEEGESISIENRGTRPLETVMAVGTSILVCYCFEKLQDLL